MTTPVPDTVVRKKRAALRVFGESFASDLGEIDDSLTYSTVTEKSAKKQPNDNDENSPNIMAVATLSDITTPKKPTASSPLNIEQQAKKVSFAIPDEESKENSLVQTSSSRDLFLSQRSPLRPDLVKRTREAILKATISVNETMKIGKIHDTKNKRAPVVAKAKWMEQIDEAREFNDQMHESRLRMLQLQKQMSSQASRDKAKRHAAHRWKTLQQIDEESQFKSFVYREQQKKLREEQECRRRMSVDARAKLRENAVLGEEEIRKRRIEEEQALIQERHEASIALREKISQEAAARRKSFKFRNGDGQRIRELYKLMELERQEKEREDFALDQQANRDVDEYKRKMEQDRRKSLASRNAAAFKQRKKEQEAFARDIENQQKSFKLKFEADRDVDDYKKQLKEERRLSFAKRNEEANRQRIAEEDRISKALEAQHESLLAKWDGERDAEAYRQQLEASRRQSLAFRNKEGLRIRKHEAEEAEKKLQKERESYELKWDGERDAIEYQKQQARARRESLAFRNAERKRHATVMEELQQLAREKEHDVYTDKWAADNDVKEYLAQLENERRESLRLRGKQVLEGRKVEEKMLDEELEQQRQDEEFKANDQKDVQGYKAECAKRDRHSLEFRGKELVRQRLETSVKEEKQQEEDKKMFELESQARKDVEEYLNECRRRRRMSLALRAKETRRHAAWKREREDNKIQERRQLVHGRLMDQRYVELARQEEKAKQALEAIRHANRTSNPFAGLL